MNRIESKMSNLLTVMNIMCNIFNFAQDCMSNFTGGMVSGTSQFGVYSMCPEDFQAPGY